ncbi:MAG: hypothetical protein ACK52A_16160 [Planctomycetota bacterium]
MKLNLTASDRNQPSGQSARPVSVEASTQFIMLVTPPPEQHPAAPQRDETAPETARGEPLNRSNRPNPGNRYAVACSAFSPLPCHRE